MLGYNLSSQLTPHPHPEPLDWGFSTTWKLLPIISVTKSMVDPLSKDIETASTTTLEGLTTGCENTLYRGQTVQVREHITGVGDLTNRLVGGLLRVPFCIGTHGILQTQLQLSGQPRDCSLVARSSAVAV